MKEEEIRPPALYAEYLRLAELDASASFPKDTRRRHACVACAAPGADYTFSKFGFDYVTCRDCGSLFLDPRPSKDEFDAFYRDSMSSRYWNEVFFPSVAEVRREAVARRKVELAIDLLPPSAIPPSRIIDIGAGYGIFLEEWAARWPNTGLVAVEPSASLAHVCRSKGFEVVEALVEDIEDPVESSDLATCFEVLEHAHDPLAFLQSIVRFVRPGGWVAISTLTIDGFDLRILQEQSSQISPPFHINFLTKDGLARLSRRAGLADVSLSTPGELDVDIVRNALRDADPSDPRRVVLDALASTDASAMGLQEHLKRFGLSSHIWLVGRRPSDGGTDTAD